MAEKVGGIEYTVDADASSLKTAGEAVTSSTNKMVDDFGKVDKQQEKSNQASKKATDVTLKETKAQVNAREVAARKIVRSQEKVAKEIKDLAAKNQRTAEKTAQVIAREAKEQATIVQREARETSKIAAAEARKKAKAVEMALKQEAAAQKAASNLAAKSTGQVGRRAGMAGIQIEQFVGSVQGGQDAMRAFSFQATDMGIVLGAPLIGAAVGLGAALVSVLIPALSGGSQKVEELTEKLKTLAETSLLTADQAEFLAAEEKKSQKEKSKTIAKLEKEIKTKEKSIATDKASIEAAGKLLALRKGQSVAEEKSQLNNSIKKTSESLVRLKADLSLANLEFDNAAVRLQSYDLIVKGNTSRTGEQTEAVKKLLSALNEQLRLTGKNERALLEDTLARAGANDAEKAAALGKYDLIKAKEEDIAASKKSKDEDDKLLASMIAVHASYKQQAAQLELNSKQLDEYNARKRLGLKSDEQIPVLIQEEINALEELRLKKAEMMEQDKANQALEKEFKAIQVDQGQADDPLVALEEKLTAEREIIKAHTDLLLANEELTQQQRNAIVQQGQDLRTGIDEDAARARQNIADMENKAKINAVSQMFSNISSLMNTESKKMFEIGKAAAVAGAIVDGYAAITGAYKFGAKIGGPVMGGAFAAAAAVQTAVQIQNIAKQKIGGAQTMGASGSFSGGTPVTNTQPQSQAGTNVNVSGINASDMFTGQQMLDTIRAVVGDGADVSFLTSG
jgi:hypothetical protein